MENTNLQHYGVKGMRWGVRRTPAQLGYKVTGVKKKNKKGSKVFKESKPKELTPEEKKSRILESRSAKTLYENRRMFNYEEMNRAYKLLETDKKVKDLIVHEPNKVEKFVDSKLIPWANRVKNFTSPVVDTMKKLDEASKLFGGEDNKNTNTKSGSDKKSKKNKSDDNKEAKSDKNTKSDKKSNNSEPESVTGNVFDNGKKNFGSSGSTTSSRTTKTFYDVDFEDVTPSRETTSVISAYLSNSVKSLPSSSRSETFVAGLLEGPKE